MIKCQKILKGTRKKRDLRKEKTYKPEIPRGIKNLET